MSGLTRKVSPLRAQRDALLVSLVDHPSRATHANYRAAREHAKESSGVSEVSAENEKGAISAYTLAAEQADPFAPGSTVIT